MSDIDTLIPPDLIDFLDLGALARIVDVGCGNGSFTSYLMGRASPASVAIGLDIDAVVLREARLRKDVELVQAVAEQMPIRSDSADLVICRRLLMNLPKPQYAVQEMTRVARPGGLVAAMEPWDPTSGCYELSLPLLGCHLPVEPPQSSVLPVP